ENAADSTALALTQELGLLARLDGVFADQLRTLQHAADLAAEGAAITARTQNPRPPAERFPTPRGLARLDQLYAERDYLVRAKTLLEADLENAAAALADARDDLEDKDRQRRTAKEARPGAADGRAPSLPIAELESRLARETEILAQGTLKTLRLQQSLLAPKLTLVLPDLTWLHANLVLADDDVAAREAESAKRIAELDAALDKARDEAARVTRLVVAAERRAAARTEADPDASDDELESRRADRQTVNLALSTLATLRDRQTVFDEVDDLRRRVLSRQGDSADYKAWASANRDALERLPKDRRVRFRELRKSRQELQDLRARLASPAKTDAARNQPWVADRVGHLTAWIAVAERDLGDLANLVTAREHLAEELGHRVFTFSLSDTLASTWAGVVAAWDYEVFSVADQPVRVKTILTVIVLLFVGHWASRRASDLIGRTVFHRLGMNTGHRAAWQTLSFYALFLVVLLTATNLFHLSLTQFSVVSGALAVGIGFGSQTLISNFISGIILLLERPVNQGDVIEIDGQQLTVERLGPRSTIVRSFDNAQIIVPNSRLLEENVINWTLSDDVVRTRINVGVAYGSPTREVARLLEEVMLGLEEVQREPAPLVAFIDFGESALNFEASFWSSLQGRKELESELRHRIAESFANAGIVMAFPQRD
ncbi:MAG: mechanosensitive ion channel, partial [Burkholderiales bacterium]|nr:mechanosensitive ion channel [Opitutaceae bacterium]